MKVVVDTNVLVSALISPISKPASVLGIILSNTEHQLLLSPNLLAEYEEVLGRKKFVKRLIPAEVAAFLWAITKESLFITPSTIFTDCKDPKDNMLLELAVDGEADFIVTGDLLVLELNPFHTIPILSASDFLQLMQISD